jgi:hypothetical protein
MKNAIFVFGFLLLGLCACDRSEPAAEVSEDNDGRASIHYFL